MYVDSDSVQQGDRAQQEASICSTSFSAKNNCLEQKAGFVGSASCRAGLLDLQLNLAHQPSSITCKQDSIDGVPFPDKKRGCQKHIDKTDAMHKVVRDH